MKPDYLDLIGAPFAPFGRGPAAYDCLGFAIEGGRRIGVTVPDYGSVDPEDKDAVSYKIDGAKVDFEEVTDPRQGDLVEFRADALEGSGYHIGIMITDILCLHTTPKTGGRAVPLNQLNNKTTHKIARFWRCKKAIV
jgi:hypothetical protein